MKTAKDIMTRDVITVPVNMTVVELAKVLLKHDIGGVPVVDMSGKVVAVVTENDLIAQNKRLHVPSVMPFLDGLICLEGSKSMDAEIQKMTGAKVGDICSQKLITVNVNDSLEVVATVMSEQNCHTLPVMDYSNLMGVIGKADVVRVIAQGE